MGEIVEATYHFLDELDRSDLISNLTKYKKKLLKDKELLTKINNLGIIDHYIFISPIKVGEDLDKNANKLSLHFYEVYERLAKKYKPDYLLDAQAIITPSFDNCHFKEEDHYVLAKALASFFETKDYKI